MKIAEAAAASDLSVDTIRFYEGEGLLDPVARGSDGHRRFSPRDLRWLSLFQKLRATGMPLAEMKRYADLARAGEATYTERRIMLEAHQDRLAAQQAKIDACRSLLDEKVRIYRGLEEEVAGKPG